MHSSAWSLAAGPGLSANALPLLLVRGSLRVGGVQRLDETLRPFWPFDVDGVVVPAHGAAGRVDVIAP